MATAVLVLGPESSGTRYLASLLIAAGLRGSAELEQPFDLSPPTPEGGPVVWRRSLPHGRPGESDRRWPDLNEELLGPLDAAGFDPVRVLQIARDPWCCGCSQLQRGFAADLAGSYANQTRAHRLIGQFVAENCLEHRLITYPSLLSGAHGLRYILADWGLSLPPADQLPAPIDANAKWL
jgi:hypothetical protein